VNPIEIRPEVSNLTDQGWANMLFRDRSDAGRQLARALGIYRGREAIVLGIPRGGVAVGHCIALELNARLDVIIPRKLPVPFSPETGFGAIAEDGSMILNERLVGRIRLPEGEVRTIAQRVLTEIQRRVEVYRGQRPAPELKSRVVILVDDGLATGYTMLAAIESVKKKTPSSLVVAVPCGPASTLKILRPLVDDLVCMVAPDTECFAVASFYQDFHEMSDREVVELLNLWADPVTARK